MGTHVSGDGGPGGRGGGGGGGGGGGRLVGIVVAFCPVEIAAWFCGGDGVSGVSIARVV